jgi:hypothetical protein
MHATFWFENIMKRERFKIWAFGFGREDVDRVQWRAFVIVMLNHKVP